MAPSIGTTDIHPVGWLAQIFSSTEQTTGWRVASFSRPQVERSRLFRRQSHPTGTGVKADLVRTGRTLPLAEPCVASVVRGGQRRPDLCDIIRRPCVGAEGVVM